LRLSFLTIFSIYVIVGIKEFTMPMNTSAAVREAHVSNDTLAAQITDVVRSFTGRMLKDMGKPKKTARVLSEHQMVQRAMTSIVRSLLEDDAVAQHQRNVLAHLLLTANLLKAGASPPFQALAPGGEADDPLLSSEEAAKLLHVSRTHINMLIDSGKLGEIGRTEGGHRRIARGAVLKYKADSKLRRAKGIQAMVEATDKLGLYDREMNDLHAAMKGKRG
jgi:excisionase family DNA binding protein